VTIVHLRLALRGESGPLVPGLDRFAHITLDQRTVEVLEKLATAVHLGEPCLLEGETSTSKTTSIEYLAALTQTPLVRMSLSGQTDTSELIGKFVPNDGQIEVSFDELLSNIASLTDASRAIVERAHVAGRALTLFEAQQVAAAERLAVPAWRWQNGVIPEAMEKGYWVILDELNLAEAQVLERLNPVIERHPSLVVSENQGTRIAPGGDIELHPGFRVFATMNPANYAGRSTLSPAYKDRWTAYKYVSAPSEREYAEMLALMVSGEQPLFSLNGDTFGGGRVPPLFSVLSTVEGLRGLLPKLAKFHATVEGMARRREIGRDAQEPYSFSRRSLIELCSYLERMSFVDRSSGIARTVLDNPKEIVLRALRYFYLDKIAQEDDLKKVNDQLDAIGISEREWHHDFRPPAPPPPPPPPPRTLPLAGPSVLPVRGRPQLVQNLLGGTIHLSLVNELGGYKTGDMLRLRATAPEKLRRDVGDGRLEVIGVSTDQKIVVQIDGDKCLKGAPDMVDGLFERVVATAG
jgi:MoxR-like ATPase